MHLIAIAALAVAPATANADSMCPSLEKLATSVMEARQANVPLGKAMDIVRGLPLGSGTGTEAARASARAVVEMAYEQPRYDSEEYKHNAVVDFANKVSLMCYQTLEK